jgi:hypothetical protein
MNEAYWQLWTGTLKETPEKQWMGGGHRSKPHLPLALAETEKQAREVFGEALLELTANASVKTFAGKSEGGDSFFFTNSPGDGEGLGTVLLEVRCSLRNPDKSAFDASMQRLHEFKVASIVSKPSVRPRSGYAQNFIQDYALFVKEGVAEFGRDAKSLNPGEPKITIFQPRGGQENPDKFGKIYLGTNNSDSFVFVNTTDRTAGLIPQPLNLAVREIQSEDCLLLFPAMRKHQKYLSKLKGVFMAHDVPVFRSTWDQVITNQGNKEQMAVKTLFDSVRDDPVAANPHPGIDLLQVEGDFAFQPQFASKIFEGRIRQRFIHFVHFWILLNEVLEDIPDEAKDAREQIKQEAERIPRSENHKVCVENDPAAVSQEEIEFQTGLKQLAGKISDFQIYTTFETDFRCEAKQAYVPPKSRPLGGSDFPGPVFFAKSGRSQITFKEETQPYEWYELADVEVADLEQLRDLGILEETPDAFILKLRGIILVNDSITLGDGKKVVRVMGQGALVADSVTISSGIITQEVENAQSHHLLVLVAKSGGITIKTDQPIHAGLVALQDGQGLNFPAAPTGPLNLIGMLAVSQLKTPRWPAAGVNKITYDPRFKADETWYQVSLSPWVRFQRFNIPDS